MDRPPKEALKMKRKPITQALVILAGVVLACVLLLTGCAPPASVPTPSASPTPVETGEIKGLVSVGVIPDTYNDDRDPENDGVELYIALFDRQEEPIAFKDIPLKIEIKLYTTEFSPSGEKRGRLVYDRTVEVDHTEPLGAFIGNRILLRIPFEDIEVDPVTDSKFGIVEIAITTPSQGVFEARSTMVMLYDIPPE